MWNGSASVERATASATGNSPGPVAEAAVERLQVDGRQVRLAGHAARLQCGHHGVAVDGRVEPHDVDEPGAHVAGRRRRGDRDAVERSEQLVVARGDRGARGEDLLEPLGLRQADGGRELVHAVVEAELVVLEPVARVGAALVGERAQARGERGVVGRDHAALARGHLLVRVEREHRGRAGAADAPARYALPTASQASSMITSECFSAIAPSASMSHG